MLIHFFLIFDFRLAAWWSSPSASGRWWTGPLWSGCWAATSTSPRRRCWSPPASSSPSSHFSAPWAPTKVSRVHHWSLTRFLLTEKLIVYFYFYFYFAPPSLTCSEIRFMLLIFFVLLFLIFILMLVGGILGYVFRNQVSSVCCLLSAVCCLLFLLLFECRWERSSFFSLRFSPPFADT